MRSDCHGGVWRKSERITHRAKARQILRAAGTGRFTHEPMHAGRARVVRLRWVAGRELSEAVETERRLRATARLATLWTTFSGRTKRQNARREHEADLTMEGTDPIKRPD